MQGPSVSIDDHPSRSGQILGQSLRGRPDETVTEFTNSSKPRGPTSGIPPSHNSGVSSPWPSAVMTRLPLALAQARVLGVIAPSPKKGRWPGTAGRHSSTGHVSEIFRRRRGWSRAQTAAAALPILPLSFVWRGWIDWFPTRCYMEVSLLGRPGKA